MRDFIVDMANNNIGSLCVFLKATKNSDYLEYLNSNLPDFVLERSISEKVYYFVNNITRPLVCICGDHLSFIGFKSGYRVSCGKKKCFVELRKVTCIEKWGVDNPKKSKDVFLFGERSSKLNFSIFKEYIKLINLYIKFIMFL